MAFDFKKEYKEFYLPAETPGIVTVPPMNYIAVRGQGDPNEADGAYKAAVAIQYALAYTLKMSKRGDHRMEGYFDYVVPPLEGFWWQDGRDGVDYTDKRTFRWISAIRLPDFVRPSDMAWAKAEAENKKKLDCSAAEFLTVEEGLCVQILHVGPFDDEPVTVGRLHAYLAENGYETDFSDARRHHEIYLSDARKVAPERQRTVIRHPIRRCGGARAEK